MAAKKKGRELEHAVKNLSAAEEESMDGADQISIFDETEL